MNAARVAKTAIKIPNRIERGPTDILKALASTVKYLPDQPGPSLQDDPYLLPMRPIEKKIYVGAKLSGIKTAHYIFNKYPELFFRDDAEPKIAAFTAPEKLEEDMDLVPEDLISSIKADDVLNAKVAYKVIKNKGIKLDDEILLQFFELISFSNEDRLLDQNELETGRVMSTRMSEMIDMTWKKNGLASKIFNEIKDDIDPSRSYSIMIGALSKYNEHTTAFQVFEEFKNNHPNKPLYNDAYNALLISVPRLSSSLESTEKSIQSIVQHMRQTLVKPDVRIFNSIIKCYYGGQVDEEVCKKVFRLLNDMKNLNIEMSLTTINYVIGLIGKFRSGRMYGDMIPDLLNYAKSDRVLNNIQDRRDFGFLRQTMKELCYRLNNIRYANQLHQIYLKNPNLMINEYDRRLYLDNYFKLIITMENLDNIMDFYRTYRAMDYEPSIDAFEALGDALDLYQAPEEIVKEIYDDIVMFQIADKLKNSAIFMKYADKKSLDELPELD